MLKRCAWVVENDEIYVNYHDNEWGVPLHDDVILFEFIVLESFQAGLSWQTILHKRENFRSAFAGFDPYKVAAFDRRKIDVLLNDKGIIRNRAKIESAINNAKVYIKIADEFGSFDNYIWKYVNGEPIVNNYGTIDEVPSKTELSQLISSDLKKRGFRFFGAVICYSFMQAVGMVNDHTTDCFKHSKNNK